MKQKLVIFEGADKTGKSTLITRLNKLTNFSEWVLDRSIISCIVYDILFDRPWLDKHEQMLVSLAKTYDLKVIFTYSEVVDIEQRLINVKEFLPNELLNIDYVQGLFKTILNKFNITYLELNTSTNDESTCISKICAYLEDCV